MDLFIYGVIGDDFWGDGVLAKDIAKQLSEFDGDEINVYINSPGGYVHEGNAIANALERHPATVNVVVDGFALSAASRIMVCGDTVKVNPDSQVMIHDAWNYVAGDAAELRKVANELDKTSDIVANTYAKKTGKTREEMRELMKAETWMDANEAVEMGFADSIVGEENRAEKDMNYHEILNRYRNTPAAFSKPLEGKQQPMSKNEKPESVATKNEAETPENDTPETDTPETETPEIDVPETDTPESETPETETPEAGDDRNECRLFLNAFGSDGGEYFASGMTFEEAQAKHNAKQQKRIADLEAKASGNATDEDPVSTVDENKDKNSKRTFADLLTV